MESSQLVKSFITSAKEYSLQKTEVTTNCLQRYLQILSATNNDLPVFNTGCCEAAEFYITLYNLMAGLDVHSEMVWYAVGVLQVAARNSNTRKALIYTYKFTPILTKLLNAQLLPEKRYRVLKLLEELTYGIKITWQEGHLPCLIQELVKCIGNNELISVALGVLVNICYKNMPAVYTLMKCIDTKDLIKSILVTQGEKVDVRVQLCKLMMILDELSGDVPDSEILMFVKVTYSMMEQAFKSNNVNLLQHIVDFFKDMKCNAHARNAVVSYPGYYANTEALITLVSEENNGNKIECTSLFIEFLEFLLLMEVADLHNLYPRIVKLALGLLHQHEMQSVSTNALDLLYTVTMQCRTKNLESEVYSEVTTLLEGELQTLLSMLETWSNFKTPASHEHLCALTSLLHLLQELNYSPLSSQIVVMLSKETFQRLFSPLLSPEQSTSNNLFEQPASALYVQVLCFLSELVLKNIDWLPLYSSLLNQKQILKALAVALYSGSRNVKQQVLFLRATYDFPKDSLALLAECMTEVGQQLSLVPSSNVNGVVPSVNSIPPHEGMPVYTLAQQRTINNFISKLEDQYAKNQMEDLTTCSVIELYQYKLSAMNHAERALHVSLEAATSYSTHLNHRVAQLSAELNRLHHLFYTNQQVLEGNKLQLSNVKAQLEEARNAANISYNKYNKLKLDMQSKKRYIIELSESSEKFKQKAEALEKQCNETEGQVTSFQELVKNQDGVIENLKTELAEKNKAYTNLEEQLHKREQTIVEKEADIAQRIASNEALEREVAIHKDTIKELELSLSEKNNALLEVQEKYMKLEKMREVICEISTGKFKMDPKS